MSNIGDRKCKNVLFIESKIVTVNTSLLKDCSFCFGTNCTSDIPSDALGINFAFQKKLLPLEFAPKCIDL